MIARTPPGPGRLGAAARRRAMVARHLERVYGRRLGPLERIRLVDEVFASYARYWAESFRIPGLSADEVAAGIEYDHYDRIEQGLQSGKGVILALPHLGGWEWAGTDLVMRGLKVNVVVEALEPPDVFEWFVSFRQRLGMKVIPVGPGAASRCASALAANEVLCLLCDRTVVGTSGVEVEFFGERTKLPGGPATLALRSGAAILPAAAYFDDEVGHRGVFCTPIAAERTGRLRDDVVRITQTVTRELEKLISQAPTQWHNFQPTWPSDLS